ncbi:hypothetical protein AVW11_03930 [Streptomyces amritsarensis]|uniref:Uncharacterized protein n=2 Tax=Streptomyces amritsarensis TaxID=681158 RepID=A0ABX3GBV1_9ACTN|nr:hypothetical protein AVW11_03930 [Streptomyces amritsarensis]
MPTQPPTVGAPSSVPAPTPTPPPVSGPAVPTGGGLLAPVTLARPTRDASGGSAAYASQGDSADADGKPGKGSKNTASPGMWKGIAAYIANRPQQQIKVQHTISEIRGSSTDRKVNHGITEKKGATSDSKSNRSATTAHASKSDKSAKDHNTRDAKTSAASTKADKNSNTRDAKTSDTRSSADKNSRDAKTADTRTKADKNSNTRDAKTSDTRSSADKSSRDAKTASDHKDHNTHQQAGKTSSDTQDRTARDDKTIRKTDTGPQPPESKPTATQPPPKAPTPGSATAPTPATAGDKPTAVKPGPAANQPEPQPRPGPAAPTGPTPTGKQGKAKLRKGPYTAQPAREEGFKAGAQQAAVEADTAAWKDGYADGEQAIRDKAARDKQQMDAARDRTRGVPVPAKPTAPPAPPTPPVPTSASGVAPLGATVSGDTVQLSNGSTKTRGEIRTLRSFTRFLDGKQQQTHQITDQCKQAKEVSAARVQQIQTLVERCQDPKIKGGKHLIAALQKLHEATELQAREAEKMHGNAQRGIEALRTLNHNAKARHGGVYKAVADSPETSPAERAFYAR